MKKAFLIIPVLLLTLFGQAQTDPKPFITTWQTTSDNESITIPTTGDGYSYSVDWGDGNTDNNVTGDATHAYTTPDTYTVTISGTFPRIHFRRNFTAAGKIRSVEKWGDNPWTSMNGALTDCNNLTIADEAGSPDLSNVTDMTNMFNGSSFNGDISEWDVSNVTNMSGMFNNSSFNGDISKWNTSSVTNMEAMFFNRSSFNGDISEWDVSSVTNMIGMFFKSSFNGDISKWNVSSVTNMEGMFGNSSFNGDLSKWNTSSVTDMANMFYISTFNQDISEWDVSSVTDMSRMFSQSFFNQDISKWDVSNVTNMLSMFNRSFFNQDISKWDVSSVTNMEAMFLFSPLGSGSWNISTTPDMEGMFEESSFNQDLSKWDISGVTNMRGMFEGNTSMSSENYDKLLIGWSTKTPEETRIPPNITFNAPDKYSCRGEVGRETLIDMHSWTIEDDELITIRTDAADLPAVTAQCQVNKADLTAPTAKSSCTMGEGTKITAMNNVSEDAFPITSDTLITWTYTHNGKSIVQTQAVTIADTEAPTVSGSLDAITARCSLAEADVTVPTATDNCDGDRTAASDVTFPITSDITITWTYTDDAGNAATQTQEVTITACVLSAKDDVVEAVVFPNPSGRYVEVQSSVESPIRILSVGGELVLKSTTNTRVDAASLRSGLYLIQLPDGHLLKFVKR